MRSLILFIGLALPLLGVAQERPDAAISVVAAEAAAKEQKVIVNVPVLMPLQHISAKDAIDTLGQLGMLPRELHVAPSPNDKAILFRLGEIDPDQPSPIVAATQLIQLIDVPVDKPGAPSKDAAGSGYRLELERNLANLEMQRTELSTNYGPQHPSVLQIIRQIEAVEQLLGRRHSGSFKAATEMNDGRVTPAGNLALQVIDESPQALQARYEQAERQAAEWAAQLRAQAERRSGEPDAAAAGEKKLRELVQAAFQLRMRLQTVQLVQAEANLQAARERLARRERIADKIIERRVAELVSGEDMSWLESTPAVRAEPAASRLSVEASPIVSYDPVTVAPASNSYVIRKTNVRGLRKGDVRHPDFDSVILVEMKGDDGITSLNPEGERAPLGPFNVDNYSGPGFRTLVDDAGNKIRAGVRMECASAPDRFWERLQGMKVELNVTREDFDYVLAGNALVKVLYLPDAEPPSISLETLSTSLETLSSSKLETGTDVLAEADRRGQPVVSMEMRRK